MLKIQVKSMLRSVARCDFLRREEGTIAIEAMIIMPLLFWTYLSMFSVFNTFRMYNVNQKAAYTIGDAISRETVPIDSEYLAGAQDLFEYLSRGPDRSTLRVTSVWYDAPAEEYHTDWSKVAGSAEVLTNEDVKHWFSKLPILPDKERLLLVETWSEYEPPFETGLEDRVISNFVFTRPRYAPRVCWETCN